MKKLRHKCKFMLLSNQSGIEINGLQDLKRKAWRLSMDEYQEDLDIRWCRNFKIDYCPFCGKKL